jgi:FtsH-binding integral membrane protein
MHMLSKRNYLKYGFFTFLVSFVLLWVGVSLILRNTVNERNLVAYAAFSILAGVVGAVLIYTQAKIAAALFYVGLIFGYFEMYRTFINGLDGWGDLIGILSLFIWSGIGLGVGLLLQAGARVFSKKK